MTREEAKDFLYSIAGNLGLIYVEDYTSKDGEKMREAIKALEQEPCEDAISRSETIKYLNTNMAWYDEDGEMADSDEKLKVITDLINGVPSVTPSHKKNDWIPCSVRLPEEHEWIGTKKFGTTISDEVYVTFENPEGKRFVKHLSFQNGKLSSFDQNKIDAFYKGSVPIAWMPLPEPYKAEMESGE